MTSSRISLSRSLTTDSVTYQLTVGGDGTTPIDIDLSGRDATGAVVDTLTGEIRPGDLSDVLGLVTSTLTGLAAVHNPRAGRRKPNQGVRWTAEDDERLMARHREGAADKTLMDEFGRTRGGIRARLEYLGEISPPAP